MPPKKKAQTGYQMAEFVKPGTTVKDAHKREWVVGNPVGQGGFGMLYLCDQKGSPNDVDSARYVMKIEPKQNGPLFTEVNYYMRNCKETDISQFAKKHKLKVLGIPKFIAAGVHEYNKKDVRYLVMPRFGRDLQKMFEENGKKFNRELISQIAIKVLYVIQYIHERKYAHADIKGANILLGNEIKPIEKEEVFLIDFGLAYLVPPIVKHIPDPRCKHDGTIEYCSTDAHDGCKPSFRGDIEILSWCLCHWASGSLPWLTHIKGNMTATNKENVANQKRAALKNPKNFLAQIGLESYTELENLLTYSTRMNYDDVADFEKCRSYFKLQLPKDKNLSFTKVKSRKSFVSLDHSSPVQKKPASKAAPASVKRRAISEDPSYETAKPPTKKIASVKKETHKIATPRRTPKKEAADTTNSSNSTRPTRRLARLNKKELESIDEISSARRTVKKKAASTKNSPNSSISTRSATRFKKEPESLSGEEDIHNSKVSHKRPNTHMADLSEDDEEGNSEDLSQQSQCDFELDSSDAENIPLEISEVAGDCSMTIKHNTTSLDSSNDDMISRGQSPLREVLKPKIQNRFNTTVNHPKSKKRMMQPGKLVRPVDGQTQTWRSNGEYKSWLLENPAKLHDLRLFIGGLQDHY